MSPVSIPLGFHHNGGGCPAGASNKAIHRTKLVRRVPFLEIFDVNSAIQRICGKLHSNLRVVAGAINSFIDIISTPSKFFRILFVTVSKLGTSQLLSVGRNRLNWQVIETFIKLTMRSNLKRSVLTSYQIKFH